MSTVAAQSGRNGVDTAKLFATVDAVKAHPEAARFQFSVTNRWISGTHNRNQISTFFGVGAEQQHATTFAIEADHPAILVGEDAETLDAAVRAKPEAAYDYAELFSLPAADPAAGTPER